jgi:hypothetical protein
LRAQSPFPEWTISSGGDHGDSTGSIRPIVAHSSHNACSNFQASIHCGNAAGKLIPAWIFNANWSHPRQLPFIGAGRATA